MFHLFYYEDAFKNKTQMSKVEACYLFLISQAHSKLLTCGYYYWFLHWRHQGRLQGYSGPSRPTQDLSDLEGGQHAKGAKR